MASLPLGEDRPHSVPGPPLMTLRLGVARGMAGLGSVGEPGVQPFPDFPRGVSAAAAFGAGDHHPGGGHTCKGCQSQHLPPAHLLRLDHARREYHSG